MFTPADYSSYTFPTVDVVQGYDKDTQLALPDRPMPCSWIVDNVPVTKENLLAALEVTEEERVKIWSLGQREDGWHMARRGRITGSRIPAMAGKNPYCPPRKLLKEWLYQPVIDNAAMKHGRDNEDCARNFYKDYKLRQNTPNKVRVDFAEQPSYIPLEYRQVDIQALDPNEVSDLPYDIHIDVRGLVVHPTKCYIAYSSDGEVTETDDRGLLEIKCPRRMYDEMPNMYYCQCLLGMYMFQYSWVDFVVWTPRETSILRYPYNEDYFLHEVLRPAEDFYFEEFIPEAIVAIEKERAWTP